MGNAEKPQQLAYMYIWRAAEEFELKIELKDMLSK